MNLLPRVIIIAVMSTLNTVALNSQFIVEQYSDPLKATVLMENFNDPYALNIKYEEAPHPTGKAAMRAYLRKIKLEAQAAFPARENPPVMSRGSIPAPEILATFSGNNIITGTPLDNHLAVNSEEHVVSTINTHMLVANNTGFWLGSYKLNEFYDAVGIGDRYFDPRVIYDPEQDRFIMVLINGSVCEESQLVIAFSQSSNPKGGWNLYAIDGCLNDDNTFADYPMIAITETEFFLTYNAVHSDSTWQAGFYGTQIHQINKMNGYNGETLNRRVWRDISYQGRLLRNICPVRNADEDLPEDMYFLSDRNFSISNDTVFLLHLSGMQDDTSAALSVEHRMLDQPYGVPPYAVQPKDSLDTNDARILDAFRLNGTIQWVSNTMDFNSGRSGVYHGMLQIDDPSLSARGNIIAHPTDYLGYPGLAWTGSDLSEQDAIIVMSHSSLTRFPGGSAIYSDGLGEYSEFVTVKEGLRSVDMLTGPIERWGDYVGIQRLYHQPGSVWVSMSYGRPGNVNEAWIAKLARQEESVGTNETIDPVSVQAYPNPSHEYIRLDVENPNGKNFLVKLFDLTGKELATLYDGPAQYPGKASIHFSIHALAAGEYIAQVIVDGQLMSSKKLIKK